jgi:hypothetical protein
MKGDSYYAVVMLLECISVPVMANPSSRVDLCLEGRNTGKLLHARSKNIAYASGFYFARCFAFRTVANPPVISGKMLSEMLVRQNI